MDLKEIRKLIEAEGGKIIVVENDQPVLVITSYGDYARKSLKTEKKEEKNVPPQAPEEDLKIEDLPF